jgi:hypothetical protein
MTRHRLQIAIGVTVAFAMVGLFLHLNRNLRQAAERSRCKNNLRSLAVGIHNHASANNDRLPRAVFGKSDLPPEQCLSWLFELDPFIESRMDPEWTRYRHEPWDSENNLRLARQRNIWVNCPASEMTQTQHGFTITHYVGVLGVGSESGRSAAHDPRAGILQHERWVKYEDVKDGTGFTIAIIETSLDNGPWIAGGRPTTRFLDENPTPLGASGQFGGLHRDCVNVAMLDGSVRTLRLPFDRDKLAALFTIAGGEGNHTIPE